MAQESSMKRLLLCVLVWFADAAKRPCDDPPPVTIDRLLPCRPLVPPSGTHVAHHHAACACLHCAHMRHVPPVGGPHHRTIGCQVPATPPPIAARAPAKTPVPANATAGAARAPRAPRNLAIGAIGAASTDEDFRRAPNMVSRFQGLQHQMDIVIATREQAARQESMLDHMLTTVQNYVSGFAEHVSPSASSSSSAAPAANAFGAGVPAVGARVLAPLPAFVFGAWKNQPPACYPTPPPPPPAIVIPRYSNQAGALVKKPRTRFETIADEAIAGEATAISADAGSEPPSPRPYLEACLTCGSHNCVCPGVDCHFAAAYVETVETQANETQLAVNAVIDVIDLAPPQTQPPDESEDFVHDGQLPDSPDSSQNID